MAQPKFIPKPGQVDYTAIRYCPVVNVIPVHDGKVLLVQRAADLNFYPSYWHWKSRRNFFRSYKVRPAGNSRPEYATLPVL